MGIDRGFENTGGSRAAACRRISKRRPRPGETTNKGRSMTPPREEPVGKQTREGDDSSEIPSEPIRNKADVFVETGLVPEDYVLEVVESNGGRLKQQTVCDTTGWSDGAVSRILSGLEDDGRVDRVRLGRQKVVFLPELKDELLDLTGSDEEGR